MGQSPTAAIAGATRSRQTPDHITERRADRRGAMPRAASARRRLTPSG